MLKRGGLGSQMTSKYSIKSKNGQNYKKKTIKCVST